MNERARVEKFWSACGGASPMRLRLTPDGRPASEHWLEHPFAVIGRDADCDLVVDDPDVSGRHLYLQVLDGHLFAIDLESRSGLRWGEGGGAAGQGWALESRAVRIGAVAIQPLGWDLAPGQRLPPLPTDRSGDAAGSPGVLDFFEQGSWRINRRLVLIGRSPRCRVRLPSMEVSRFHLAVVVTDEGPWVVDLLSRGGTLVNGDLVRAALLVDGDELRLGPHRLCYRQDAVSPARSMTLATQDRRPSIIIPPRPPRPASTRSELVRPPASPFGSPAPRATPPIHSESQLLPQSQGLDPVVAPLLREFGAMQQQMADQFQQALMMMFRMFCDMHADQSSLIREELARIRTLSEEQQALREELARRGVEAPPAVHGSVPSAATLRLVTESMPATPPPPTSARSGSSPPPPHRPAAPLSQAARPAAKAAGLESVDLHTQLVSRLAEIESERQGRWQRLVGSLMGKGGGGLTP